MLEAPVSSLIAVIGLALALLLVEITDPSVAGSGMDVGPSLSTDAERPLYRLDFSMDPSNEMSAAMAQTKESQQPREGHGVCIIGGKRIIRSSLQQFLVGRDINVRNVFDDETQFAEAIDEDRIECDVAVLILSGGPFGTFHRIRELLDRAENRISLVVLSQQTNRGQVYAAMRIGAKAYVNLDADPEELIRAINVASHRKVYLSPDAAELLVSDISASSENATLASRGNVELSRREQEIVQLMCEGMTSKEIARHLHISAKTVENHRYNIYRKCDVDSLAALMRHAIQRGLVSL